MAIEKINCGNRKCKTASNGRQKHTHACVKKRFREANPMKQVYYDLRTNAKRRGKEFAITFEEFSEFAIEVNLLAGRGRERMSWTVDRKDDTKGYVKGNLQKLTNVDNLRKRYKKIYYDFEHKYGGIVDVETGHEIHPF